MRRLFERIFRPKTIALVGGSSRKDSPGYALVRQFLAPPSSVTVFAVNPKYQEVQGIQCYAQLSDAPQQADLVIVCTPYSTFETLTEQAGQHDAAGILFLTGGPEADQATKHDLYASLSRIGRQYQLRILGPNTFGLILPHNGLRATLTDLPVQRGSLALITQSGALGLSVLDWASQQQVGFSCFVSLGASIDLNFGDRST